MATMCFLKSFSIRSPRLIFVRLLNSGPQLSTVKHFCSKTSSPVKYTTNEVAKMQISETLGLKTEEKEENKIVEKVVILTAIAIFLIYFTVLREENDLDELLKGDEKTTAQSKELYELRIKLKYCEKYNMPTDALKAKIQEIEESLPRSSPFLK